MLELTSVEEAEDEMTDRECYTGDSQQPKITKLLMATANQNLTGSYKLINCAQIVADLCISFNKCAETAVKSPSL